MKSILIIAILILLIGCQNQMDVDSVLKQNAELSKFIEKNPNYVIKEEKIITIEELNQLQNLNDSYGEWYKKIPSGKYKQLKLKGDDKISFIVLINEKNQVERILGLISVDINS